MAPCLGLGRLSTAIVWITCTVLVQSGSALVCYNCTSVQSSNCKDPFKAGTQSTCIGVSCVKVSGSASSGGTVQIRFCSDSAAASSCYDYNLNGIIGNACDCATDLCNTAAPSTKFFEAAAGRQLPVVLAAALMVGRFTTG